MPSEDERRARKVERLSAWKDLRASGEELGAGASVRDVTPECHLVESHVDEEEGASGGERAALRCHGEQDLAKFHEPRKGDRRVCPRELLQHLEEVFVHSVHFRQEAKIRPGGSLRWSLCLGFSLAHGGSAMSARASGAKGAFASAKSQLAHRLISS